MFGVFDHHRSRGPFDQWASADCNEMFFQFVKDLHKDNEIVYEKLPEFENYKDSTVLIVGGGPSARDLDLDEQEYDYLWSINHFFKSDKFKDAKADLLMVMGEPDTEAPDFLQYRDKYKPAIGFEIHDRWQGYKFDNYEKYFCMHTRFYGRVGGGVRMLLFAAALGCKKVMFTGFDGPEAIFDGDHAFEPGKKSLPTIFAHVMPGEICATFKLQYDYFWDYIQDLHPHTQFENLGGGEKYHEKIHR
jgi:hypothetical protein